MFQQYFLLTFTLVFVVNGTSLPELDRRWNSFKATYEKHYGSEEAHRRSIWEQNTKYIEKHNNEAGLGLHTYKLGMNKYGDMTASEFALNMNGLRSNLTFTSCHRYLGSELKLSDLPTEVNWTREGYVTDIKDQGSCGSCWAFAATGALEGQLYKKTKKLVSLSEKNLMDCSWKQGNMGCQGGLHDKAYKYVIENGGIDTEASYPYKPKDGKCTFNKATIGTTEKACFDVGPPVFHEETILQKAVAEIGPVSVGIDAASITFQLYKSGIYTFDTCSKTDLDHSVLVVGYGTDSGQDYWLVKNSWGKSWGEAGYIRMRRNYHNMCGIATQASFPTI